MARANDIKPIGPARKILPKLLRFSEPRQEKTIASVMRGTGSNKPSASGSKQNSRTNVRLKSLLGEAVPVCDGRMYSVVLL